MNRKFFIVANPLAGLHRAQRALKELQKVLEAKGITYHSFLPPTGENMHEFIEEHYSDDTTDVVAIGGDGTIYATINAIHGKDVTLSIIPMGTGNDFVRTIDIGDSMASYVDTAINGQVRAIDIGDCNGQKFVNGVGLGFDGQIIFDNQFSKSILRGHLRFYAFVLKILGSYRSRQVNFEIDGVAHEDQLITMAIHNGTTFGGGFKLNPDSLIDDGLLNICTISTMPIWKRFLNISRLSFGKHGNLPEISFYQAKSLKIHPSDQTLRAHIDGEYLGEPPFEIKILPQSLKIRVKP